ncbi:MAG: hypothetical protein VX278_21205 [Myxococcota bacterium]|nr:hypothetical protein [Myxococcota bacterium]
MKPKRRVVNAVSSFDIPQLYDDLSVAPETTLSSDVKRAPKKKRRKSAQNALSKKTAGKRWVLSEERVEKKTLRPNKTVVKKRSIFSRKNRSKLSLRNKRNEKSDVVKKHRTSVSKVAVLVDKEPQIRKRLNASESTPKRLWFFAINGQRLKPMALASNPSHALSLLEGAHEDTNQIGMELCSIPLVS